jgi:adenylate cyclase
MSKQGFVHELRRRRLIQVALIYVGAAFVALQAADILFKALDVPDWGISMLTVVAIVGLPVVLAVVWASNAPATPEAGAEAVAAQAEARPTPVDTQARGRGVTPSSVAVLPFVNISTDPENEFFSDGMTEELLNVLTKLGRFRVPARTSSFAYKGKNLDVREVGRQLGVETVLEGSVRRSGDRVRITSQLINVENGYHIWSERYDRELQDIFAIQDEIALCIADALNVHLTEREVHVIKKVPTSSIRAYEYYLKGRQLIYRLSKQSVSQARELLERAIEIDPDYAFAYAAIADCRSFAYMYWDHSDENLRGADEASRIALEKDPELAEAHAARGLALSLGKNYKVGLLNLR